MKRVEFTMFGKTKLVPHRTFTHNKEDHPAKEKWDATMWVERGEDWYGLSYYAGKMQTVLVVERDDFMNAPTLEVSK